MLHNTGPYGSNETPVNVGAADLSELATPMNIAQNFSNFMKMSQQTNHPTSGHFNFQNYPGFSGTSLSGNPPVNMYPNNPFQSGSAISNTNYFANPIRHNGNLPENYCFNNETNQGITDFSNYANKLNHFEVSSDGLKAQRPPFNVPQITHKEDFNQQSSDSNHDSESKRNESLVSPWKNHDGKDPNELNSKDNNHLDTNNREKSLEREHYDRSDDSSMSDQQDNINKTTYSNNTKDKESKQQLPEDNHSDNSNITGIKETSKDTKLNDSDNVKPQVDNDSDSNDTKPLNLVYYIKEEPVDYVDTSVVVKIETISSWTDTEHMQPFLKDMNGVSREDSSLDNVVDSVNSVNKAMEIIANDLKTDLGFECPNCCLLFTHPKRFLIHTKWHSFGLINEKRMEDAKEKMACRQQKKEMQILIKKEAAVLRKTEIGVFNCKDCEKTFNTLSKLRNHRHKLVFFKLKCKLVLNDILFELL
ncbi:unnamed protein product [Diatraea saccharalis]|uniref:C2H2-type domain-containing protein n=1 Tax=Diatraea saccharalis TaxID=40085 RepID=A0A9N9WIW9_9NEOP|nr:unnamed protein product [Diatraea saccharalis]